MKKFGLLLSLFFLISLAACQSGSTATSSTPRDTYNSPDSGILESEPITSEKPSESPEETEPVKRDDTDFRNAKWGDSPEAVKKYEKIVLSEDNGALTGECRILNYDTAVIYIFDDAEKLIGGSYLFFPNESKSAGMYLSTYQELKEALAEEYGTPIKDIIRPLETQDYIDFWGEEEALRSKAIEYEAHWETETTTIGLSLSAADRYNIALGILYIDKGLYPDTPIESDSGL